MTEDKIKEMLKDIIDNDAMYEYKTKPCDSCVITSIYPCENCHEEIWQPYKLGDKINPHYEYRKVEKWYVYGEIGIEPFISNEERHSGTVLFTGSEKECKKWIEEHNKTWVEKECEKFEKRASESSLSPIIVYDSVCTSIKEFSEKLLEEIHNKSYFDTDGDELILVEQISEIIKDLGVEV